MLIKKDTRETKPNRYPDKLPGMKKKRVYTENLVVLKRHSRVDATPLIYSQHEPKYNFLKYWRIVRKWASVKYDISMADIEVLLFMYDEGIWKQNDFLQATEIHSWEDGRLKRYIENGWVRLWREGKGYKGYANLYELTPKAKTICKSIYLKLTKEEAIPENKQNNPMYKKGTDSYIIDKYKQAIERMNLKRMTIRQEDGSYDK